ncbi:alpha/beta hydrolase [Cytobacillus sp. S13-E01]|uniref:alpha/beta fold hydrolase n=1 Tax=Cytobacillus sp. S13-E01 TaxID=3031326 RepID=UPI0023D7EDDD|nr:alpha/beta hydrolase [Cytobacillus sp. S13-E01]MDF0729028.1 alpha/beta hydrolase [Cytobacillus sp. S13-E01]
MHTVEINNEQMAYEDIGTGTPILFIHPPGMGRKVFYEQKPLSKHFRLLIPDLVGNGDSSYYGESGITIRRFAEDIITLLDRLQLSSVVLFGYSAGGTIAQFLSIHHPSRVKALILSGGYPVVDNFALKNEHRLGIVAVEKNKRLLAKVLAFSHTKDKSYRKTLREHMYKSDTSVWSKFYLESYQFNCKEEIIGLKIPVLLLYGSKSDAMNTYIKFYKKHLTNQQLYVIKGESHQLPTRQPNHVNQIITGYLLNQ